MTELQVPDLTTRTTSPPSSSVAPGASRRSNLDRRLRPRLRWLVTFLGFPAGGLVAHLIVGPVDRLAVALLGGLIGGAILGTVQSWGLALRGRARVAWIGATATGFMVGLGIGASVVGFRTGTAALVVQGAVCGLAVGAAQALSPSGLRRPHAFAWPPLQAALWAIGWTVTASAGINVDERWTVFGSSGAVIVTLATAAVLPWFTNETTTIELTATKPTTNERSAS